MSGTNVANRFLSGGRALGFVVWPASLRGALLLLFCTAVFFFAFSLSLLHLGFVSLRLCSLSSCTISFVFSVLFYARTHIKAPSPSPILFMDHCARTNWHMYIHKEFFPSPFFVCAGMYACVCYKKAGRFLLQGWPVQEVLVPFSLSLSLWLCGDWKSVPAKPAISVQPKKLKRKKFVTSNFFCLFCFLRSCRRTRSLDSSKVNPPVLSHTPKVSQD